MHQSQQESALPQGPAEVERIVPQILNLEQNLKTGEPSNKAGPHHSHLQGLSGGQALQQSHQEIRSRFNHGGWETLSTIKAMDPVSSGRGLAAVALQYDHAQCPAPVRRVLRVQPLKCENVCTTIF